MNKKTILIFGIMMIVLSSFTYAVSLTSFVDSSEGNLTFTSSIRSIYKNISLPHWALVTKAEIDLKNDTILSLYEENLVVKASDINIFNGTTKYIGQEFTIGGVASNDSFDVEIISFWIEPEQTNSDVVVVSIKEFNGTDPIGDDLENTTVDNITAETNDHITAFEGWYNFTMNNTVSYLNKSKQYIVLIKSMGNYSAPISVKALRIGFCAEYDEGDYYVTADDGVTWTTFGGNDLLFGIWGKTNERVRNLTIKTNNGNTTYFNSSDFNGTVMDIDLNVTALNDCVTSCSNPIGKNCNCELNFTSATNGNLKYFNLDIEYGFGLDNCTNLTDTILTIYGNDEETNESVNMSLDLTISVATTNVSFSLSNDNSYSFCSLPLANFTIDSIMEYGDGTIYANRKYYLNNFTVDTSTLSEIFLYHLNYSKASEITFTVFDTTTGDKVSGAFIKILRYYPGENVFRTVEIDKTDEVGQTLGKMVLVDVFYKFIIEKPAGTIKLDTGTLRILALTRSFGISFVEDVLATWDKIHGVSTSVTCTKGTQTCRITWSDSSNIVRDATLEVWRTNGITDELLSTQTTTSAAGTISYTIVETTLGNAYTAKGFIESNTGTSTYGAGIASLIFPDNPFFTDSTQRIASLFPLLLLVIVIVFALIDWGVIGIVIGSLLGLIIGSMIGVLPLSPFYLISFILMAVILIYKLSK